MSGFITEVDQWAAKCVSDPQWVADCLHRLYRFGGQHPESTVCRHSLEVWWMVRELSPAEQLWALVHDAHEILSGEITRGWKANETAGKQTYADVTLWSALGISTVDLLQVHMADIAHGAIELEALRQFNAGEITRRQLDGTYRDCWHAVTHEWVDKFETLKGQL
jgi:hypothetical protein